MRKNILTLSLVSLVTFSNVLPTFAYEVDENDNSIENIEYQNTNNTDFTDEVSVYAQIGSEYKVTIPKTVVLSGVSKKADYLVKVAGDIAGYETVKVIPDENFKLLATGKDAQTAKITQDKTSWKVDDFDTDANGNISAPGITAGKWQGAFNFEINLDSEEPSTDFASGVPGLYDARTNTQILSWDELVALGLDVEKDYSGYDTDETYIHNDPSSGYSIFTNNNLEGKLVLPNGITKIGAHAFDECTNLYGIKLPNTVTLIGEYAFSACENVTSFKIPSSVKKVGEFAFAASGIETMVFPDTIETLDGGQFFASSKIKNVTFPKDLKEIKIGMFYNCSSIESITLPDSVETIEYCAFYSATNLKNIKLSKNLKSIGEGAFAYSGVVNVIIPASVESIEKDAFASAYDIASVTFEDASTWYINTGADFVFDVTDAGKNADFLRGAYSKYQWYKQ